MTHLRRCKSQNARAMYWPHTSPRFFICALHLNHFEQLVEQSE